MNALGSVSLSFNEMLLITACTALLLAMHAVLGLCSLAYAPRTAPHWSSIISATIQTLCCALSWLVIGSFALMQMLDITTSATGATFLETSTFGLFAIGTVSALIAVPNMNATTFLLQSGGGCVLLATSLASQRLLLGVSVTGIENSAWLVGMCCLVTGAIKFATAGWHQLAAN